MLGFSLPQALCTGLLGFAVHRTDHDEDEAYWLRGKKTFLATDPGLLPGANYSTRDHPVQGFTWSDFSAKPDHRYTYRVVALTGTPENLSHRECAVEVTTEPEAGQVHSVFFNRGAAASQEYAHRFGTPPNENNPDDPRWAWLSRGAMEALTAFLARATDNTWGIRVAAYEFRLAAVGRSAEGGARLRRRRPRPLRRLRQPARRDGVVFPRDLNLATATAAVSCRRCTTASPAATCSTRRSRITSSSSCTHNGQAEALLTGSTNFSLGGVFGQSTSCTSERPPTPPLTQLWPTSRSTPSSPRSASSYRRAIRFPLRHHRHHPPLPCHRASRPRASRRSSVRSRTSTR